MLFGNAVFACPSGLIAPAYASEQIADLIGGEVLHGIVIPKKKYVVKAMGIDLWVRIDNVRSASRGAFPGPPGAFQVSDFITKAGEYRGCQLLYECRRDPDGHDHGGEAWVDLYWARDGRLIISQEVGSIEEARAAVDAYRGHSNDHP